MHAKDAVLINFVKGSNSIEGINRAPLKEEIDAHVKFLNLRDRRITVDDLCEFVSVVANRPLRMNYGDDVYVGSHTPPPGGPEIKEELEDLLFHIQTYGISPYQAHVNYELLHPFMDGNGRSGRVLWAYHMMLEGHDPFVLSFLHLFYYQSLDAARRP